MSSSAMSTSFIPRKLNSTVRYIARPAMPVTKSAPAAVQVDKITAALDKLTVATTKTTRSIAPVAAPAKTLAAQRIEERRRRVADKISKKPDNVKRVKNKSAQSSVAGSKRSTPAASAANSRSTSFSSVADKPAEPIANPVTPSQRRYGFLALNYLTLDDGRTFKQFLTDLYPISDKIWDADSLIPTAPDSDWILVGHPAIRQAKLPRVIRRRGADNYCDGRPCRMFDTGQFSWDTLSGSVHAGRSCICHAPVTHLAADKYHISPRNWATTPAEADLEPSRPRKVRFLGDDKDGFLTPVTKISTFERWYNTAWPASAEENHSWTLDEDLAIDLLLHPFFGEPEPTMEPQDDTTTSEKEAEARPKDDLDAIWGSAMATKFDDESDSESECNDSARPEDRDADDKAKLLAKFSEDISSDDEFF